MIGEKVWVRGVGKRQITHSHSREMCIQLYQQLPQGDKSGLGIGEGSLCKEQAHSREIVGMFPNYGNKVNHMNFCFPST